MRLGGRDSTDSSAKKMIVDKLTKYGGYGLISMMKRHPADTMTRHFIEVLKKVRGEK